MTILCIVFVALIITGIMIDVIVTKTEEKKNDYSSTAGKVLNSKLVTETIPKFIVAIIGLGIYMGGK